MDGLQGGGGQRCAGGVNISLRCAGGRIKGAILSRERMPPLRPPRERKGLCPLTPPLQASSSKRCDTCRLHFPARGVAALGVAIRFGNVKKCAVGKHPKSEKHGNTAQFSKVERSGTQENCGGIGSGCRLHQRPLPVLRRRQSQRVARIDPNAVVVDKNIAENDRFDLFSR